MANADKLALVSTEMPRQRTYREILHDANCLFDVLKTLRLEKRSGVLTINFAQGTPAGTIKWTEPERKDV